MKLLNDQDLYNQVVYDDEQDFDAFVKHKNYIEIIRICFLILFVDACIFANQVLHTPTENIDGFHVYVLSAADVLLNSVILCLPAIIVRYKITKLYILCLPAFLLGLVISFVTQIVVNVVISFIVPNFFWTPGWALYGLINGCILSGILIKEKTVYKHRNKNRSEKSDFVNESSNQHNNLDNVCNQKNYSKYEQQIQKEYSRYSCLKQECQELHIEEAKKWYTEGKLTEEQYSVIESIYLKKQEEMQEIRRRVKLMQQIHEIETNQK